MKKIYIAGQHVFHKDALKKSKEFKEICKKHKLEGVFPMDKECDTADQIFKSNIDLLKNSDFVIAYIEPFRGISLDPGTAMEIGFAKALGIPVFAYKENHTEYKLRANSCEEYPAVEDFGLGENLMIEKACIKINSSFSNCVVDISNINFKKKIKGFKVK
jgi:nucleoside 2-deoxyribosyltransferase